MSGAEPVRLTRRALLATGAAATAASPSARPNPIRDGWLVFRAKQGSWYLEPFAEKKVSMVAPPPEFARRGRVKGGEGDRAADSRTESRGGTVDRESRHITGAVLDVNGGFSFR
jgi:hypothetical protein